MRRGSGIRLRIPGIVLLAMIALVTAHYKLDVFAGVRGTKHDLSSSSSSLIKAKAGVTTEICVFCHTPHGAINPTGLGAPLWNHNLSTANYTVPDSSMPAFSTMLSVVGQPDRGSRLCLSCHDGTVALGSLANTPGPGSKGSLEMVQNTADIVYMPPGLTRLGTDISGHHPVSIAVNDALIGARNCDFYSASLAYPTGAVKLRPTNAQYNGQFGKDGKGVQCRSCHDPHNNNPSWGNFFVKPYSQLCISCHVGCP
ncbi:MAG TPA: cytochrome c3 family protein [Thermodesulfovibrionales bacterium]|nr:cytochrome c3 family protein [Thermodesulfovibrionales bacterium]